MDQNITQLGLVRLFFRVLVLYKDMQGEEDVGDI